MKRFLLILLTITVLLGVVSCKSEHGSNPNEIDSGETNEKNTHILVADLPSYSIVYSADNTGKETMRAIHALRKMIKTRYNVSIKLVDDLVVKAAEAPKHEILVGVTNRPESKTDAKKIDEYEIAIRDERLVIIGGSDEATAAAVMQLIDSVCALSKDDAYFFQESMEYFQGSAYPIEKIMIGDSEISDYTIVYKKDDKLGLETAEQLQNAILEKAGYALNIMTDTAAKTSACINRKLIIGETLFGIPEGYSEKAGYFVGKKQNDVYLYAKELPMQMRAIEWITEPLDGAGKGDTLNLNPTLGTVEVTDTSIKVMTFNLKVKNEAARAENVLAAIRRNDPDVLGVQEASDAWVTLLEQGLSDDYGRVGYGRNANKTGETTSIFYKKDQFHLIEWGTKWMSDTPDVAGSKYADSVYIRIFTYALLERKSDGERFMHVNVHPEDGAAQVKHSVREKQFKVLSTWINQNANVPYIVTGDMNSRPEFAEFVQLQKDINAENSSAAAYVAKTADTYSSGSSSMVLDYILLSKGDFQAFTYHVDTQKNGTADNPSDHCPVIVVCDLKKKS